MSTELIKGSGGVFEVKLGDKLVFSKKDVGQFPDEDQLLKDIAALL